MSNWQHWWQENKSFTLIELIVSIAISIILLISLFGFYFLSQKGYTKGTARAELVQNARIALERMSREIRQAEEIISELPGEDSPATLTSEIKFQDGHVSTPIRYITYSLEDFSLHRKISHYYFSSDPGTWVVWNAQDSDGNPPTESQDSDQIKAEYIKLLSFFGTEKLINIRLQVSKGKMIVDFRTKVLGRNIK